MVAIRSKRPQYEVALIALQAAHVRPMDAEHLCECFVRIAHVIRRPRASWSSQKAPTRRGDRLYVVLPETRVQELSAEVWAGPAPAQRSDGRGIFVEHRGHSQAKVEAGSASRHGINASRWPFSVMCSVWRSRSGNWCRRPEPCRPGLYPVTGQPELPPADNV